MDTESGRVIDYEDSKLRAVGRFFQRVLTTAFASLYPALAILALYRIDSTLERIEVTIGFTLALGLVLNFFTSAKIKETIAITAR